MDASATVCGCTSGSLCSPADVLLVGDATSLHKLTDALEAAEKAALLIGSAALVLHATVVNANGVSAQSSSPDVPVLELAFSTAALTAPDKLVGAVQSYLSTNGSAVPLTPAEQTGLAVPACVHSRTPFTRAEVAARSAALAARLAGCLVDDTTAMRESLTPIAVHCACAVDASFLSPRTLREYHGLDVAAYFDALGIFVSSLVVPALVGAVLYVRAILATPPAERFPGSEFGIPLPQANVSVPISVCAPVLLIIGARVWRWRIAACEDAWRLDTRGDDVTSDAASAAAAQNAWGIGSSCAALISLCVQVAFAALSFSAFLVQYSLEAEMKVLYASAPPLFTVPLRAPPLLDVAVPVLPGAVAQVAIMIGYTVVVAALYSASEYLAHALTSFELSAQRGPDLDPSVDATIRTRAVRVKKFTMDTVNVHAPYVFLALVARDLDALRSRFLYFLIINRFAVAPLTQLFLPHVLALFTRLTSGLHADSGCCSTAARSPRSTPTAKLPAAGQKTANAVALQPLDLDVEYFQLISQLGLLFAWGAVFPLAALLCAASDVLEFIVDATSLKAHARAYDAPGQTRLVRERAWATILRGVAFATIFANGALLLLSASELNAAAPSTVAAAADVTASPTTRGVLGALASLTSLTLDSPLGGITRGGLWRVVCTEHAVLAVACAIDSFLPDEALSSFLRPRDDGISIAKTYQRLCVRGSRGAQREIKTD